MILNAGVNCVSSSTFRQHGEKVLNLVIGLHYLYQNESSHIHYVFSAQGARRINASTKWLYSMGVGKPLIEDADFVRLIDTGQ